MKPTYRFAPPKDGREHTGLPNRLSWIERLSGDTWLRVGYVQVHLHDVAFDEEDELEDISVGVTARINPKRQRAVRMRRRKR